MKFIWFQMLFTIPGLLLSTSAATLLHFLFSSFMAVKAKAANLYVLHWTAVFSN